MIADYYQSDLSIGGYAELRRFSFVCWCFSFNDNIADINDGTHQ